MPVLASVLSALARAYFQAPFLIFLVSFLVLSASLVGRMNSMDGSQYALTKSLAENQTVFVDEHKPLAWPDVATGRDGRLVSDREPGQSIIAIPFYFAADLLSPLLTEPYDGNRPAVTPEARTQVITYTSLTFLVSLGLAYTYVLLRRLGASTSSALLTCLLICFGTLMWKYSASFVRQPAIAIFLALTVLQALGYHRGRRNGDLILMGALAGVAVIHDYMTAIPLALLALSFLVIERPTKAAVACAAAGAAPFAVLILAYNYAAFGEFIVSPHGREVVFIHMRELSSNFQTPLHEGLYHNLLSFKPVSEDAVGWVLSRPEIAQQQGVASAMKHTYKGLLVQSPFLLFALLGWFGMRKSLGLRLVYPGLVAVTWLLLMSSYTLFWSPNTYDGRYLLPIVATTGAGTAFFLDSIALGTRNWVKNTWLGFFGLSALVSLFFAWESSVINFAPNVSGEHRWSPAKLFVDSHMTANTLWDGFLETFPNVYNVYIILPSALVLYGVAYLAARWLTGPRRWTALGATARWGRYLPRTADLIIEKAHLQSLSYTASLILIATGVALFLVALNISEIR